MGFRMLCYCYHHGEQIESLLGTGVWFHFVSFRTRPTGYTPYLYTYVGNVESGGTDGPGGEGEGDFAFLEKDPRIL